ncbi:MAG: class II aldolase/adducin family protein [Spirochaetota bacterium]|uniref:class II aldolase/adducin family protein n=1 Tax=Gracilinema caldarium TaxID=215591 RepID=UPI0026F1BD88|nr:class II aldolase/adducin family protein [Gracilinema caldarium]
MSLEALVNISRKYGADPNFVIAGGGNTSYKDNKILYIKGSGTSLACIQAEDFVHMDREKLQHIWQKEYPHNESERERMVLEDLMEARLPGEGHKRPSVETMLHELLPYAYVVHTHPAIVNGLTCSKQGEQALRKLFGQVPLWIPITNPGYILSLRVKMAVEAYKTQHRRTPTVIFLQNHGIFVAADTTKEIEEQYRFIIDTISRHIKRFPQNDDIQVEYGPSKSITDFLTTFHNNHHQLHIQFRRTSELARYTQDRENFLALQLPFTPDHIVYAGSNPLFIDLKLTEHSFLTEANKESIKNQWKEYLDMFKRPPKIIAVSSLGVFGLGLTERAAELAIELISDAAKVACFTDSFGGPRHMEQIYIDFINNWEVEQYRSNISTK